MKLTIRRGRKIGDPGYSSTDVGIELSLECDDELYYDRPTEFAAWFTVQSKVADDLLEAEIRRIYSTRPGPAETVAQREREHAGSTNGNGRTNGYHDGDREIDQARSRDEPRNGSAYRNGDGASTKPRTEWNRTGEPERPDDRERDRSGYRDRPRDDRSRGRDDRRGGGGNRNGGGSYGPPKTGKQLFAWAHGQEERGAEGFVKALGKWCKEQNLPWRFDDLQGGEVLDVYDAGQRMLEDAGGY